MKKGDNVKVHIYSFGKEEVKTRNYNKIFVVKENGGSLGIDWNKEKSSCTCGVGVFTPFEAFADTVIFENVKTGEKFHFSDIENGIVRIA